MKLIVTLNVDNKLEEIGSKSYYKLKNDYEAYIRKTNNSYSLLLFKYVKDKNKIIKVPLERSKLRDASLDIINEKIKDILSIDCDISQLINV